MAWLRMRFLLMWCQAIKGCSSKFSTCQNRCLLCPEGWLRTVGSYGRALIDNDEASLGGVKGWQVGVAVAVTLVALLYMGRLAQQALDEAEQEEGASP